MTDWWQILAVLAIAVASLWLWRRSRRPHRDCPDTPCQNCPLADRCQKK